MNFISCKRHPDFKISHLYLKKDKIEILCGDCLEENFFKLETFQIKNLIHIKSILQQPQIILKKLDLDLDLNISSKIEKSINMNPSQVNEQIKEIEKLISDIQQHLQQMLQQFKSCVKKLEDYRKQLQDGILEGINFDSFKQIISGLSIQKEESINPDAIEQIKVRLSEYFEQLQQNNVKGIKEIFVNENEIQKSVDNEIQQIENLDQLQLQLEKFQKKELKLITSIFPNITQQIQSSLLSNYQQYRIKSLIKQRTQKAIKNFNLIYLGTRDGFTAKQFWSKVNGKDNLLMVFKSKSNYIFGGYSPCKWQMNLDNYVQDDSLSSFLFSQTHDEIYPLKEKQKQYAIYCRSDCGPIFGVQQNRSDNSSVFAQQQYKFIVQQNQFIGQQNSLFGQQNSLFESQNSLFRSNNSQFEGLQNKYQNQFDIFVAADFQKGDSQLGYSYRCDEFQNQRSSHLFGQETPNIIECEIYEIIFQ